MTDSHSTSTLRKWLPAVAVMASAAMEMLDTSVVNVSLRHIAGSLSATVDEATWILTSYIVANAIVLPMSGWLASRFGRKNLLMAVVTWCKAQPAADLCRSRRRCFSKGSRSKSAVKPWHSGPSA